MEFAGETRSDARVASEGPRTTNKKRFLSYRGGLSPAIRDNRDREVSPTGEQSVLTRFDSEPNTSVYPRIFLDNFDMIC